MFGVGPGEGAVKHHLPDAHADFIFAVAGEEFGLVFCILLIGLFATIMFRGSTHAFENANSMLSSPSAGFRCNWGCRRRSIWPHQPISCRPKG